ncbi:TetR family transcriptional regulator [Phytohabitans rumicis]|uniref:TetR family transcriptional regulator n=1 Tax=Phytohabitans rumicis TaxID=1076125 RepID=A0A6V8LB42_9ACTN|nr:TetR family transcriptional regulator [Phytohabitans rumicis]
MVRSLLARTATELFAAKGYDDTTLEEVATAAGVSRRTLFNYFRNKEDLALSGLAEQGELIAARLAQRPADEDAWAALRAAFQVLEEIDITPERRLELVKLLFGNESLRAGHAEKQARWQDLFAPLIEPRLPDSDRRTLQARAIAAAAITCLQAANEEWARLGGQAELFDLYDAAVHAIRRPA